MEAHHGGGVKKAQQWMEGNKTYTKKIGRNGGKLRQDLAETLQLEEAMNA
jgi:hypothetical protein